MALIVNADDFGISRSVNDAIAEAFSKELIDRTTLMVNMPYAKDAMELAHSMGFAQKVGIHLNLTSGKPLTQPIAEDPAMCGPSGDFTAEFARDMKTRFFLPRKTRINVETELRAQLDAYRDLGGTLWHVDSHHHVHTDPSVWMILKRILKEYPVTSVRRGRNMYRGGNILLRLYKLILNMSIGRFCERNRGFFGSAEDYAGYVRKSPGLSEKYDVEVMVHPVYDDDGKLSDLFMENHYGLTRLH